MKKLALFLALCLLAASLPLYALGEEVVNSDVEAVPAESAGETGAPGLMAVPDDIPAAADDDVWLDPENICAQMEDWAVSAIPEEETSVSPDQGGEEPQPSEIMPDFPDGQQEPADGGEGEPAANALTLGVGEKFDLRKVLPEDHGDAVKFATDDKAVARVSSIGFVKAVALGETRVTATGEGGERVEWNVSVRKAPDQLRFAEETFMLGKGESTDALKVIVGSVEGQFAGSYKLISQNSRIVKVLPDGSIKGVRRGETTLKAVAYNGVKTTCKVKVVRGPGSLGISVDKNKIGVGETAKITVTLPAKTASQIGFESQSPDIAAVDPLTGEITGLAPGSARIRAFSYNGTENDVTVKVLPAPQALSFSEEAVTIGVGMRLKIAAKVDKGAAGNIVYTVKKTSRAVYRKGTLRGVKKGSTVLEARTYNGLTAQCAVNVVPKPTRVKLPYSRVTIGVNQQIQLTPDIGDSVSTFAYTSSDSSVVTVSKGGLIKGLKSGKATVTVKTYNKLTCKLEVTVLKAPGSISVNPEKLSLCVGESAKASFSLPRNTAAEVNWLIEDDTVVERDADTGMLTALAPGETRITVVTHNGKQAGIQVQVYDIPEWIEPDTSFVELSEGQSYALDIEFSPNSRSRLTFTSDDPGVASVTSDGVINAKKRGKTTVRVTADGTDVSCSVSVTVWPAPSEVSFNRDSMTLEVGETYQLVPLIPEGAVASYIWKSSDSDIAEVSDEGVVTAKARGSATIGVKTHNDKKAFIKLTVTDSSYPESVSVTNAPEYMESNDTFRLKLKVSPASADPALRWTSSDESIAWVDENNVIHTSGFGYVLLSAVSRKNGNIKIEFSLAVETDDVVLTIPARTTDIAGISKNLAKIEAIHSCAIDQLKTLYSNKVVSGSDALKRKSIIDNAFKDYAFPWMTPEYQKYWNADNSEGGVKDFKPDRVYYGLPYISGSGNNRAYNAAKALAEARYTDSGKGYYLLNRKNPLNGKYCGSDCSCFVDAAIWGTNSSHSADRTADIAVSNAYKTISGFKTMRPGDLICRGYKHVVMFLYYANAEKDKIMIIENGGIEPGTNTVHCMIMDVSYYEYNAYRVRRLSSLG